MKRLSGLCCAVLASAGIIAAAGAVQAQGMMPMPDEAAAINSCLCLQQANQALGSQMAAKTQALAAVRQELAQRDAELQGARGQVDVNNPESVARFKQMLEQRDAVFRHSTGPIVTDAQAATERYNASVNQYNAQCASRPFDSVLMSRIQATLSCPPI